MGVGESHETQEHTMTSYITQTAAREHIAQLIGQAELGGVRRQFRLARREARAAARSARKGARADGSGRISGRDPYLQYLVPAAR
jgi:ribosomal protein L19E